MSLEVIDFCVNFSMMRQLRGRSDGAVTSFHKQTSFSYDDIDMIDDVFQHGASFDQVEADSSVCSPSRHVVADDDNNLTYVCDCVD